MSYYSLMHKRFKEIYGTAFTSVYGDVMPPHKDLLGLYESLSISEVKRMIESCKYIEDMPDLKTMRKLAKGYIITQEQRARGKAEIAKVRELLTR